MKKNPQRKPQPRRPSLTDVAKACGFSRAAVSLALRDDRRIPEATRHLIHQAAKQLNYQANPVLARILTETVRTRHSRRGGTIAYIATRTVWDGWRQDHQRGLDAACQRAAECGFKIELLNILEAEKAPERLHRMLWSRGFAGLLIPALNYDLLALGQRTLPIKWEKFVAVEIDDTMKSPVLNRVRHNHLGGMWKALDALEELGYRRIGFCVTTEVDLATHHRWVAAWMFWRSIRGLDDMQPFVAKQLASGPLRRWIRQQRIEAIVSPGIQTYTMLRESGVAIPEELGFASLDAWGAGAERVSGIDQRRDVMNGMAVDLLVTLINRGATGIPEHPTSWTFSGYWQEGITTRRIDGVAPVRPIEEYSMEEFPGRSKR